VRDGKRLRKAVDEVNVIRCKTGSSGVLREEVFVDVSGQVVKYNLAFIHFALGTRDHGRLLGYDNAHGGHERHWMGEASEVKFSSYADTLARFLEEIAALKEKL